jgi:hypothetical protein
VGRDALMQVDGAQFYRGPMPASDPSGPKVVSATLSGRARAGGTDQACSGELEAPATAVAIGLRSDVGYWIVPAKIPAFSAPNLPTFQLVFAIAPSVPTGTYDLLLDAVDGSGRFGPATTQELGVDGRPSHPSGRFVISLTWDNVADLDLHVVLPNGIEVFGRDPTEYQRPPPSAGPVPPGAPTDGGVLDRDSNAQCVGTGLEAEDVVWTEAPPRGHYLVRVDTFSLCGAASAPWRVEAILNGARIGAAQGTSTPNDERFSHDRGSGLLVLELDVP